MDTPPRAGCRYLKGVVLMAQPSAQTVSKLQREILLYTIMQARCGMPEDEALQLIGPIADELLDVMWSVDEAVLRLSQYGYAMYDYEGGLAEAGHQRLAWSDYEPLLNAADVNVDTVRDKLWGD